MKVAYDDHYLTQNLFGEPYPELIEFLENYPTRGKLLDLGCGQGRDSLPLARLGFEVTGIDNSIVGIDQLNMVAQKEDLSLTGLVEDIYAFEKFMEFDFILLDSMFHFGKKEFKKETEFVRSIVGSSKKGTIIIFCIQDSWNKVKILNSAVDSNGTIDRIFETTLIYNFRDETSGHCSSSKYKMIVLKK